MIAALIVSWFLVGLFITLSKRRGWGQPIRAEMQQSHQVKAGTPTGGGIGFTVAVALVWGVLALRGAGGQKEGLVLLAALGMGLIGLIDDVLKIRSRMVSGGRKELLAREKFPLQFIVALLFAIFAQPLAQHDLIPSLGRVGDIIVVTLAMVAAVNAFNFADGVDGLLAGVSIIVLLPLIGLSPLASLMIGALVAFLWFNAHPARVFMGDMGSFAIGALVAGSYVMHADIWLLPIAAIIPVVAVISVGLQILYFRRTGGKRLFKMTPIQHHFELSGWPETHVTLRFWAVTALGTMLVWYLLGNRP